jgi:hypothetical protein
MWWSRSSESPASETSGNIIGTFTGVLTIISAAVSVISGIFSLFSNSKEKAEQLQYQYDLQIKAIDAINQGLERQLEITKQLYGPERISGYLKQLDDIRVAEEGVQAQLDKGKVILTGNKETDDLISQYNSGTLGNDYLKKTLDADVAAGKLTTTAGKLLPDLEKLMDLGKLDDSTKALVQSLIDLQQQAIDTRNALNEDLTGTSFDSLTNDILQMFQQGKTALTDFASEFQTVMQTAILNSFKRDYLENQLQSFYDDLSGDISAHGQLSKDDIAKLQQEYNTILQNANQQFQQLQQVTGVTLTATNSATASTNSLTGAIQGMTEQQADLLAGQFGGLRLTQLQTNDILTKNMTDQLAEMRNQTLVQKQIEANTREIRDVSNQYLPYLKSIDSSVSSSSLLNVLRAYGR